MSVTRYRLNSQIKFNIKSYLDREFINSGLYINVASGSLFRPGQRIDILSRVNDTLYESFFDNWIYETDATGAAGFETINASGIIVDGIFQPRGSGTYLPEIDYRRGRVIFGVPVPATSTVETQFSYKHVLTDFVDSSAVNLIFSNFKDSVDFSGNTTPSGIQRQLPLVVIDPQRRIGLPGGLGGQKVFDQTVVFHVLANSDHELDQIVDILTEESFRKVIIGIDFNKIPLLFTNNGDRASTYKDYTTLQADNSLIFSKIYIDEAKVVETFERHGLRQARVDWNVLIYKDANA